MENDNETEKRRCAEYLKHLDERGMREMLEDERRERRQAIGCMILTPLFGWLALASLCSDPRRKRR